MTPGLLALQFLLCAALIGVAGYGLCQSADRIAQATGLTGGWIGLALLATVTSLPRTRFGHHMIGLVMRPQGRELRVLSWVSAGLLVLGARGAGLLQRLVVGSTSERLLRRSTRPMLVVKQTPQGPYRRALVALDFSSWSAQAIPLVRCVAPQARVLLLNVFEAPFEGRLQLAGVDAPTIELYRQQARHKARQQLDTLAQQAGLQPAQWDACVVEGEAWQCIVEQEQAHDCDLVVVGKHGQSAAEELLLGSLAKSVLAEGRCDVLVSMAHAD